MLVFTFLLLPQRPTLLHFDQPHEAQQKHSHGLYCVVYDTKAKFINQSVCSTVKELWTYHTQTQANTDAKCQIFDSAAKTMTQQQQPWQSNNNYESAPTTMNQHK